MKITSIKSGSDGTIIEAEAVIDNSASDLRMRMTARYNSRVDHPVVIEMGAVKSTEPHPSAGLSDCVSLMYDVITEIEQFRDALPDLARTFHHFKE